MKKHLIDYVEWEGYWCTTCRTVVDMESMPTVSGEHPEGDICALSCKCSDGENAWTYARFWLAVVNPGAPGNTSSPWPDLTDYRECGIIHPTIHVGVTNDTS